MEIRRLAAADWEANREIRLEALASHPGNYFTSLAEAEARSEAQWRAMLADPRMAIFGLFDGDALAGMTAIYIADADPCGRTAASRCRISGPPGAGAAMRRSSTRPGSTGHASTA